MSLPLPSLLTHRSPERRWAVRDWVVAAGLFLDTAGVILWQNAHLAVLWDLSYVLDSAARIAAGQTPYRDFPFAHAPLTFLVQAALLRLAGRVFWHTALYAAVAGALGTVLAWRMALQTLRGCVTAAWSVALLLAAPLVVLGLYCILPHPSYDCDCAFSILVAVALLQRLENAGWRRGLVTGAALGLPLFFKQNMGLAFLAAALGAVCVVLAARLLQRGQAPSTRPATQTLLAVPVGAAALLLLAAIVLHVTAGIGNYLHWTIGFAAQRRMPGLDAMLSVYRDPGLLWTLPCAALAVLLLCRSGRRAALWPQLAAFALFAAPFLWTLSSLLRYEDADERGDCLLALWPFLLVLAAALVLVQLIRQRRALSLRTLLPLVLLATINGTLMSQQLWGSTYAIWPLLVLLLADLLAFLAAHAHPRFVSALAALIGATLLACGSVYTASEERLSYVQLPGGPPLRSAFPQLAGMATPGPYLPQFDELLRYAAAHIPFHDGLLLLPGEDPFYYVTGRAPRFPVLLFDPATDPYSPAQVAALVRSRDIRWLIVKRALQLNEDPTPQRAATLDALLPQFTLAAHLRGYDVYQRAN